MKGKKSGAIAMFIGSLLIVVFVVGLACEKNPGVLSRRHSYDLALEMFSAFCANWWLPAGIIGFPLFLISLILNLIREGKEK